MTQTLPVKFKYKLEGIFAVYIRAIWQKKYRIACRLKSEIWRRDKNNCDRERKKQREIEQNRHNSIAITELGVDFLVALNCMHSTIV